MRLPPRLALPEAGRARLLEVAAGDAPADLVLRGGRIVNVYTGRVEPGSIGVAGGRIAWVGDPRGPAPLTEQDLDGGYVTPGLIEPHCHADVVFTPGELVRAVVPRGTTLVCADTVFLASALDDDALWDVLSGLSRSTLKFLWNLGNILDGFLEKEHERLGTERLVRMLDEFPGVVASAEMAAWPRLLERDPRITPMIDAVMGAGLRVDGHAPGASEHTLTRLAAAGVTADHESITTEELERRVRLGYWVMLRESSLRPDAFDMARGFLAAGLPWNRVMLTTDGPVPAALAEGHLDRVVRLVIEAGVPPVQAITLATLNPATYLGLDAHVGGIAPGRCADLVVVSELETFVAEAVLVDGEVVEAERIDVGFSAWRQLASPTLRSAPLDAEGLERACQSGPALRLDGIITRRVDDPGPRRGACAALVDRHGRWVVGATLTNVDARALAVSYTGSGDVLLLGRDPAALVDAYHRLVELGGGFVTPDEELELPVMGYLSDLPVAELALRLEALDREVGLPEGAAPLVYVVLFLSLAVLPEVRLTPRGCVDVRSGEVLSPPHFLA